MDGVCLLFEDPLELALAEINTYRLLSAGDIERYLEVYLYRNQKDVGL